jgi:site-specific recombinase XerD
MNDFNVTLSQLVPQFIQDLNEKRRSPSTILAYGSDLEQLVEYLAHRSVTDPKEVKLRDLEGFRDHLLSHKYTPKSTSRKLNAVKTFFRWVKDEGYIEEDPSREVSHPEINAPLPAYLSPIEYRSLRDTVKFDPKVAAMIELILQTGMRISEVANLKVIDVKRNEVIIEAYATQPERRIPLNDVARESIEEYLRDRRDAESPYLFVSKSGKPLAVRNIRASVDRYLQRAELSEFSVNDIRNTFIVENIKRGVDLVTISQAAGHRRISTTERYLEIAGVKESGHKPRLENL